MPSKRFQNAGSARIRKPSLLLTGLLLSALPAAGIRAESPFLSQDEARDGLVDLDGRPRDLAEFRRSIVVVNFWATWCIPCREEMPLLVEIAARRPGTDVVFVGVSMDRPQEAQKVGRFARDRGIGFPIWLGATTEDMTRLGLGTEIPATAVLDRDGRVAFRVDGVVDGPRLDAWIDWLLGDRTSSPPPEPHHAAHDHGHHHGPGVGLDGPSLVPS
jgi:thiol-disulfide isomerase/thioredoxin